MKNKRAAIQASVGKKLAEVREISCPKCGEEMIRTNVHTGQSSFMAVRCPNGCTDEDE